MKNFWILTVLSIFGGMQAEASPVRRLYQDVKLPTQQVVEKQTVVAPAVNNTLGLLNAHAGPTSAAAATISTFLANPDVPRNILITPAGTTNDVAGCTVTMSGTNIFDKAITEDFVIALHQSTATTGSKAFKTLTSLSFPINCESGGFAATWSVGQGSKLGLKRCMAHAVDFLASGLGGTREGTFATIASSATAVESNTATLSSTLNGSDVQLYFMQNFGCFP